jgi:hypothetical protein
MTAPALAETLIALVESLHAPPGSRLTVERATLKVPLEGRVDPGIDGPVFTATLPHTRWITGFLPPVHTAQLDVAAVDEG